MTPPTLFFRDRGPVRAACPPTARIIPLDMASENVERSVELAGAAERDDTLAAFCRAAHEMAAERDAPIPWNGDEGWQKTLNEMARHDPVPAGSRGERCEWIGLGALLVRDVEGCYGWDLGTSMAERPAPVAGFP